jgi:hypothetical protein
VAREVEEQARQLLETAGLAVIAGAPIAAGSQAAVQTRSAGEVAQLFGEVQSGLIGLRVALLGLGLRLFEGGGLDEPLAIAESLSVKDGPLAAEARLLAERCRELQERESARIRNLELEESARAKRAAELARVPEFRLLMRIPARSVRPKSLAIQESGDGGAWIEGTNVILCHPEGLLSRDVAVRNSSNGKLLWFPVALGFNGRESLYCILSDGIGNEKCSYLYSDLSGEEPTSATWRHPTIYSDACNCGERRVEKVYLEQNVLIVDDIPIGRLYVDVRSVIALWERRYSDRSVANDQYLALQNTSDDGNSFAIMILEEDGCLASYVARRSGK